MRTLIVLRHGKAEGHAEGGDFARVLTHRGEENASEAGKRIAEKSVVDLIVSSDAARALSTARIAAESIRYKGKIDIDHGIYEATVDNLIDIVKNLSEEAKTVLIVGHNPGFEGLVYRLAEDKSLVAGLGTANYARLEFDIDDWGSVTMDSGRIVEKFSP